MVISVYQITDTYSLFAVDVCTHASSRYIFKNKLQGADERLQSNVDDDDNDDNALDTVIYFFSQNSNWVAH